MISGSSNTSSATTWRLALETSTPQTSLCVCSAAGVVHEILIAQADSHSEALALGVKDLFVAAGIVPSQLGLILIASGPGSFTGLRIGFSFAKGLALSLKCPLRTVSSLAAAAFEFSSRYRLLTVLRDARRDELFCEIFLRDKERGLISCLGPRIVPAASVPQLVETQAIRAGLPEHEQVLISSDDLSRYGLSSLMPSHSARNVGEVWAASLCGDVPRFDLAELAALEPHYMRAVAAKTIAERAASPTS